MGQLFSGWGLIRHLGRHSGSALGMLFDAVLSVLHTNLFGRYATLHVLTLCNRSACAIAWPDFDWKEICRPIKRGRRLQPSTPFLLLGDCLSGDVQKYLNFSVEF